MKSTTCILVLILGASLAGCKVTSEKIQTWKKSKHGEAKLRTAVMDTDLDKGLRVEAAQALADLNFVSYLAKDLATLEAADRSTISAPLAKALLAKMAGISEQRTSQKQLQAKDTLFALRQSFDQVTQKQVDQAVVQWIAVDWIERGAGEHSAEKVVTTIGKEAGRYLAERIGVDAKVVGTIAGLIRKVGTEADRQSAAARLLKLAAEQDPPMEQTFKALGVIGTTASRSYLVKVASKGKEQKYRQWALLALKADPHASSVAVLGAIAGSATENNNVRAAAFEALEKIDAPEAAAALSKIIANGKDDTTRYRAMEAIVDCCKAKGVQNLLDALAPQFNYNKADVIDFMEKDIKALGQSVVPVLRKGLMAKSWISRLVAVRLVGQMGTKADVDALQKLTADRARIKGEGWSAGATVASEARAAIEQLKKK